jgi:hypothetical protein
MSLMPPSVLRTPGEVVHAAPLGDDGRMPCCGLTPLEVSRTDRMTLLDAVTCRGRPSF